MKLLHKLALWSETKSSWAVLFFTALGLQIAALYFQYGMGLEPCIMCIYQRVAVYGIVLSALLVLLVNNVVTRVIGLIGWAVSAGWGFAIAREHVGILNNSNPFVTTCEFVPNFPSWAPLHEWVPVLFEAKGLCDEDTWQFLSMGMADWMSIIFGLYTIAVVLVLASRFVARKPF